MEFTPEQIAALTARLAALEATNASLQAKVDAKKKPAKVSFKVSVKGALSMYGLGRFPVTLYKSQWETLLTSEEALKSALQEYAGQLKEKE